MTATTLTQAENDDITTSNDFRQVGLVVDPTTFGTSTVASSSTARQTYVIKASSVSGTFEVDEKITQATSGAVGKVVEYDSTLSLLYYQQERFGDFGTNSTTGDHSVFTGTNVITGATSSQHLHHQLIQKQLLLQTIIHWLLHQVMLTQSYNQIVVTLFT